MMKISYIPPAVATVPMPYPTQGEMNWMEKAMSNAIQSTIVGPFQAWCHNLWCEFVEASLPVCVSISLIALMFTFIGAKKAKKWVIIPIIIYIFIQIANYLI